MTNACRESDLENTLIHLENRLYVRKKLFEAGVPVPPVILQLDTMGELESFTDALSGLNNFVIKSSLEYSRAGTMVVYEKHQNGFKSGNGKLITREFMDRHLSDIIAGYYASGEGETVFVEPRLRPNSFFTRLYPAGLTDIYLQIENGRVAGGAMVIPTLASGGRSTLDFGAIDVVLNVQKGTIWRASQNNVHLVIHPENKAPLLDKVIPDWARIVEIAEQSATLFPLPRLAVQIVEDQKLGPLVLNVSVTHTSHGSNIEETQPLMLV